MPVFFSVKFVLPDTKMLYGIVHRYNVQKSLPGEDRYHPEIRAVAENLFEIIVDTDWEAILVCSTPEHGRSERF